MARYVVLIEADIDLSVADARDSLNFMLDDLDTESTLSARDVQPFNARVVEIHRAE